MMTPYYQDDHCTIYHGDCREILPELPKVDLVLTDPPYGIQHSTSKGASWKNTHIANDRSTQMRDWIVEARPCDCMAIFGTWKVAAPVGPKACLIWDKGPAFGMGDLTFPWKCSWEMIWIYGDGWAGHRDEGVLKGHICVSWESRGRSHPHQKPETLMSHFMAKAPRGTVLDPFMGSGTTLRAAKDLTRHAIGIELEEKYCEIAARRLEQEVLAL